MQKLTPCVIINHSLPIPFPYITFDDDSTIVHYLCTSSSVHVRYLFGHTPNIYWTYTGHILDIYWTCVEGNPLLSGRKGMLEASYERNACCLRS